LKADLTKKIMVVDRRETGGRKSEVLKVRLQKIYKQAKVES